MQRLDAYVDWGERGWDCFFSEKGAQWRDKDYRYIDDIFDLRLMDGTLLDVGCGLGDGLVYLKKACRKVDRFIGTDLSSKAIETCRKNKGLLGMGFFAHNILEPLPEKYDNIICLQTLEHVEQPRIALKNLIDATGKVLIAGVPYKNRRPDENHLWSFDESDFSDLTDSFHFDKKQKNIYWLVDKRKGGSPFSRRRPQPLRDLTRSMLTLLAGLFRSPGGA